MLRLATALLTSEGSNGESHGDGLEDHIPSVGELFEFEPFLFEDSTLFAINKTSALYILAAAIAAIVWIVAARPGRLVPKGLQNIMEVIYGFIRENIVIEVMGNDKRALKYVPFLSALFSYILVANLFEITPPFFFPPMSRMAGPAFLALLVWLIFNIQGIASQGAGHYFKGVLFPSGVPWPMYILVTPIELVSVFIVRPFSLAVRLFANMVAGHTLVTMFLVFTHYGIVIAGGGLILIGGISFVAAVGMMGFEIFVSFIQAFIFTTLAAVYIGEAIHGH